MVDENLTDEQQAELVKKWWRENGLYLVGGLVIGIGGLFGWQAWQANQELTAQEASNAFQEMTDAMAQQRYNKAEELHAVILDEYSSTPYADSAELSLAASLMTRSDAEAAAEVLRRLAGSTNDEGIRNIAKLRLGRVLLQLEDYEGALQAATYSSDDAYAPSFADLRGDIAYARGDIEAARTAYEQALTAEPQSFPESGYVQVKLDSLPVAAATAANAGDAAVEAAE